jgi:DNA-binding transcriptional ArsR family regulator
MDRETVAAMKALTDPVRLRIAGALAERPATVDELAAAIGLAPGAVFHHLARLRAGGLVLEAGSTPPVAYRLNIARLQELGRSLDALERRAEAPQGPDGNPGGGHDGQHDQPLTGTVAVHSAADAKILAGFIEGDRLVSIPSQEKKRQVILRFLLDRCFDEDRPYPEKEVNQRLALWNRDVAALRRYLVDSKLMSRAGGVYRRTAPLGD